MLAAGNKVCYNSTVRNGAHMQQLMIRKKNTAAPAVVPAPIFTAGPTQPESDTPRARQLRVWDEAMKLFAERRFEDACERFHLAAAGPDSQIADKARSYFQICERKTARHNTDFATAEEHFTYGVERMNARDMEHARQHLEKALQLDPEDDRILYTMSLCDGLRGDGDSACENLKRAISLEPKNRIMARQDPEFAVLSGRFPALRALLSSDTA